MAKKFVPIELDKTRNIRYGMVALMKIEKKLGKPFAKIDFDNEITYEEVAVIIWAGLVHEDESLTPESVAKLIDDHSDIQTAMEAMGKAMEEAFGGKNAVRTAEQSAENGTGNKQSKALSDAE